MAPLPQAQHYTFADLLTWEDRTRYELYDGQPVALASPSNVHQEICMALSAQIYNFLRGKKCKVYPAPFDVRLFEEAGDAPEDVYTVVQPDISVVCDPGKTDGHGCKGAPDLVVEVTSPSTARYDNLLKFNLYQQAGVREYWIVNPMKKVVQTYVFEGIEESDVYLFEDEIPVYLFDGLTITISDLL